MNGHLWLHLLTYLLLLLLQETSEVFALISLLGLLLLKYLHYFLNLLGFAFFRVCQLEDLLHLLLAYFILNFIEHGLCSLLHLKSLALVIRVNLFYQPLDWVVARTEILRVHIFHQIAHVAAGVFSQRIHLGLVPLGYDFYCLLESAVPHDIAHRLLGYHYYEVFFVNGLKEYCGQNLHDERPHLLVSLHTEEFFDEKEGVLGQVRPQIINLLLSELGDIGYFWKEELGVELIEDP